MFNERFNNGLEMFNGLHMITLLFLIAITLVVFYYRDFLVKSKNDRVFRYSLASLLLIFELGYHIWVLTKNEYSYTMIPLTGFCAMTNVLTIYALFFNKTKMFNILIYYAMTGSLFALLFVDTSYGIPHFRYFHYFIVHYGFLLASFYYAFTKKIEINRRNINIASIYLIIYTIIVLVVDLIVGENWFYFLESPVKEISDFFGSPWYTILWIITIYALLNVWYYLLRGITSYSIKVKRNA